MKDGSVQGRGGKRLRWIEGGDKGIPDVGISHHFLVERLKRVLRSDEIHVLNHHFHRRENHGRVGVLQPRGHALDDGLCLASIARHVKGEGVENKDLIGVARREAQTELVNYEGERG